MTTATISFREIVKLIHPDCNPNITDAGAKMRDVNQYRNDESALYRLAVMWGLIKRPEERPNPRPRPIIDPTPRNNIRRRPRRNTVWSTGRDERNRERARRTANFDEYAQFRRRNRIFQPGDTVFVRTKSTYVTVVRVTEARVYFMYNNRMSFAAKKNVRF